MNETQAEDFKSRSESAWNRISLPKFVVDEDGHIAIGIGLTQTRDEIITDETNKKLLTDAAKATDALARGEKPKIARRFLPLESNPKDFSPYSMKDSNLIDTNNRISFLEGFLGRNKFKDDAQAVELEQKWLTTQSSIQGDEYRSQLLQTTRGNLELRLYLLRTERDRIIAAAAIGKDDPFYQKPS